MTSPGTPPIGTAALRGNAPRPAAPRGTTPGALDPELHAVVARAAAFRRGLALVHRGPLECVAVLIATHPDAVARARAALDVPTTRAAMRAAFFAAAQRGGSAVPSGVRPPLRPRSAVEVVRAASESPARVAVLTAASIECAAIAFGVHPDLILAARELVARGVLVAAEEDA